jgi:hypothetical protein
MDKVRKHQCGQMVPVLNSETFGMYSGGFFLGGGDSPPVGHDLIHEVSRSHNDAPQSVGLLWTSAELVAETSTWQHTTLTTDIHASGGIRTHNLSWRAAADRAATVTGHRNMLHQTN